ncbi:hypothetical protein HDE_06151 [Halotydeus destructor]|nr:hypothetical protein HDE_06151 [Halotydeus destructor]
MFKTAAILLCASVVSQVASYGFEPAPTKEAQEWSRGHNAYNHGARGSQGKAVAHDDATWRKGHVEKDNGGYVDKADKVVDQRSANWKDGAAWNKDKGNFYERKGEWDKEDGRRLAVGHKESTHVAADRLKQGHYDHKKGAINEGHQSHGKGEEYKKYEEGSSKKQGHDQGREVKVQQQPEARVYHQEPVKHVYHQEPVQQVYHNEPVAYHQVISHEPKEVYVKPHPVAPLVHKLVHVAPVHVEQRKPDFYPAPAHGYPAPQHGHQEPQLVRVVEARPRYEQVRALIEDNGQYHG